MAVGVPVPVNALGVPIKRGVGRRCCTRRRWVAATPSGGRVLLSSPPSPPGEREALRRVGALRALGRSAAEAQRVVEGVDAELAGKDDVARGVLLDEVGEYLAHEEFMVNERRVTPRGLRSRNFSPPSPSAGGDYDDDESWRPTADEVEARWAEALGRLPDDEAAAVHARWAAGSASSPGAGPSSDVGVVALADVRDPTSLLLDELARVHGGSAELERLHARLGHELSSLLQQRRSQALAAANSLLTCANIVGGARSGDPRQWRALAALAAPLAEGGRALNEAGDADAACRMFELALSSRRRRLRAPLALEHAPEGRARRRRRDPVQPSAPLRRVPPR